MTTAGAAAVDVLAQAGVERFYTVPGESFLPLLDAVEQRSDLALVSARHESGAAFMAEADAKLTGVPAVAMATRAVGAANLSIGVHTAHQDSTPMVVLLGQVNTAALHREAFQEVDLAALYRPLTKWAVTAQRSDHIPELVARAAHIAITGRPGPTMVALPSDLLGAALDPAFDPSSLRIPSPSRPEPADAEIAELADRLARAERPVIIAGGGARGAERELVTVAERFGCGVYAAFRRQDVVDNDHPLYLGHLTVSTAPSVLRALEEADVVLVAGSRLSEITTQGYALPAPSAEVIRLDIDASAFATPRPPAQGIIADCRAALAALAAAAAPTSQVRSWRAARTAQTENAAVPESRAQVGVDPAHAIAALQRHLPAETVVTNDAGNFAIFLHRHWRFRYPRTQVAPTSGAMGYAVPAAVGAQLAAPDRRVLAVVGDGGFLMSGVEVETAVRLGAPIIVAVMRNHLYGTIALHQARTFDRLAGVEISRTDLAGFARSLGAQAVTVTAPDELDDAVAQAAEANGPCVLDILIDPDQITPELRLSQVLSPVSESPPGELGA